MPPNKIHHSALQNARKWLVTKYGLQFLSNCSGSVVKAFPLNSPLEHDGLNVATLIFAGFIFMAQQERLFPPYLLKNQTNRTSTTDLTFPVLGRLVGWSFKNEDSQLCQCTQLWFNNKRELRNHDGDAKDVD